MITADYNSKELIVMVSRNGFIDVQRGKKWLHLKHRQHRGITFNELSYVRFIEMVDGLQTSRYALCNLVSTDAGVCHLVSDKSAHVWYEVIEINAEIPKVEVERSDVVLKDAISTLTPEQMHYVPPEPVERVVKEDVVGNLSLEGVSPLGADMI